LFPVKNRNCRTSHQAEDHDEAGAAALLRDGMERLGLGRPEIQSIRGSDARKVSVAWAIARSTVVSQDWIARSLCIRSAANVSQQIRRFKANLTEESKVG
jgi:putative transposase